MTLTENELFIRSASTLLHLVRPQVAEGRTFREKDINYTHIDQVQKQVEHLDRMALLFAIELREVTAIAVSQHSNGVTVYPISQTAAEVEKGTSPKATAEQTPPTDSDHIYLDYNEHISPPQPPRILPNDSQQDLRKRNRGRCAFYASRRLDQGCKVDS
ncbi:hypothetical protein FRB95_003485 [Tulasnella sp. JGI-2019a]|nr:hypothetical protein FRB95_003485 [Tulasnella sp. JGI-2019a]